MFLANELALRQLVDDRIASLSAAADRRRFARLRRRQPLGRTRADLAETIVASPAPFTAAFATWAATFGRRIADHGVESAEREVARLVRQARRHRVSRVLVAVLADRSAPAVVRERALGQVLVALSPDSPRPVPATATAIATGQEIA